MIIKVQEHNERAITLIALVITIVIMLILAGITINMGLQVLMRQKTINLLVN